MGIYRQQGSSPHPSYSSWQAFLQGRLTQPSHVDSCESKVAKA
jgi:hypothetical protein